MGGWIWLGVFLLMVFFIWRKARKRAGGSTPDNAAAGRNINRGYAAVESNHHIHGGGGGIGG